MALGLEGRWFCNWRDVVALCLNGCWLCVVGGMMWLGCWRDVEILWLEG